MIRPFANLKKTLGKARFASTRWVDRRIAEVLGSLHFTAGNGMKLSQANDGQIHLEWSGDDACDFPFKVRIVADGQGFALGLTYGHVRMEGASVSVPQISGKALTQVPAPTVPLTTFTGTRHLIMRVDWTPVVGSLRASSSATINHLAGATLTQVPVITLVTTIPDQQRPQVEWPAGTVSRPGIEYVTLATLTSQGANTGVNLQQGWFGHLNLCVDGAGYLLYNIGG